MLVDFENRELQVGDKCYMPEGDRNYKILITKMSAKSISYQILDSEGNPHTTATYYMRMSSIKSNYLIKIC